MSNVTVCYWPQANTLANTVRFAPADERIYELPPWLPHATDEKNGHDEAAVWIGEDTG
jgi:hypothetical protein